MTAEPWTQLLAQGDDLAFARDVLRQAARALDGLAERVDGRLAAAVEMLLACRGSVIVTGIGKAGHLGQKIAATLASTGTPAHFLHPAEAVHGDLGRIGREDLVLALSNSGQTEEILRLLPILRAWKVPIIAITARADSPLALAARVVLEVGPVAEACPLGLAPSTSTTAMLALGDALALCVSRRRGFDRGQFHRFHPGGRLGRKIAPVEQFMRPLAECRVCTDDRTVRQAFTEYGRRGRRSGAVLLIDGQGRLSGIFTDSDLARLVENHRDGAFDGPISAVMTRSPRSIAAGACLQDALDLLATYKISELPVIDGQGCPLGLIDITDLVDLPGESLSAETTPPLNSTESPQPHSPRLSLFVEPPPPESA